MDRNAVIATLRRHEPELRAAGVLNLAVFGSVARGEDQDDSDVDVLVRLGENFSAGGLDHFGKLDALSGRLAQILGRRVDLVTEPVRKDRLRRNIDEDRISAF